VEPEAGAMRAGKIRREKTTSIAFFLISSMECKLLVTDWLILSPNVIGKFFQKTVLSLDLLL
jgi:hypothetical protein